MKLKPAPALASGALGAAQAVLEIIDDHKGSEIDRKKAMMALRDPIDYGLHAVMLRSEPGGNDDLIKAAAQLLKDLKHSLSSQLSKHKETTGSQQSFQSWIKETEERLKRGEETLRMHLELREARFKQVDTRMGVASQEEIKNLSEQLSKLGNGANSKRAERAAREGLRKLCLLRAPDEPPYAPPDIEGSERPAEQLLKLAQGAMRSSREGASIFGLRGVARARLLLAIL